MASFPDQVTPATLGDGDGPLDQEMSTIPDIKGWSTFGFTQLPIDGQVIPVLGLATHRGAVEPPTVDGQSLSDTQPQEILANPDLAPNQIEVGTVTLQQLGKSVGDSVRAGTGPTARTLKIVGTVTLPSIGVSLSDHVSLGRGAMLAESTLLQVLDLRNVAAGTGPRGHLRAALDAGARLGAGHELPPAHRPLERLCGHRGRIGRSLPATARTRRAGCRRQPDGVPAGCAGHRVGRRGARLLDGDGPRAARRRRRELALLKALGLTRRQMRGIVGVQTLVLLVIAIVVGIPVGIAAGHLLWDGFAASLGVAPVVEVPIVALLLGVVGLLVAGTALGTVPATVAAATPTTLVLRQE